MQIPNYKVEGIKYDLVSCENMRSESSSLELRRPKVKINVGSLDKEDIYNAFYNPATRRLIRITEQNINYGMSLVEDINQRKKLLIDEGIITNPFNLPE